MAEIAHSANPLDELAEEFVTRYRAGERPDIGEFCQRDPQQATEIRDFLSVVLTLEQARPQLPPPGSGAALRRIGDYRLLREVGRGGMGIVYEAEQESLRRRVAIKLLPAWSIASQRQVQRFEREARSAAGLHHTNIVPVFGVGEDGGVHYYVMPFIDGLALDEVLEELRRLPRSEQTADVAAAAPVGTTVVSGEDRPRPVADPTVASRPPSSEIGGAAAPPPTRPKAKSGSRTCSVPSLAQTGRPYWHSVARIGAVVADALDYAASQGVLHRDIKPSNLLVDRAGTVWVTDFGLAKSADGEDLTNTGDVLGTLRYLAPERLSGVSDLRGDIYGLGITLYEMLTLRQPFAGADGSQLPQKILHEEPPPLRTLDPEVPRDLETIVLKALAKQPRDRYQTAAALRDDLRLFLEDRPIQSRRIGPAERLVRWCRRNPLIASLEAAVAILGLAAVVILAIANGRIRHEVTQKTAALEAKSAALQAKTSALFSREEAIKEKDVALGAAETSEMLARRRYYAVQMSLAEVALRANEWSRVLDLLNNQQPSPGQRDLRGFEWHYLQRQIHRGLDRAFRQEPGEIWALEFSPDGKTLAVCSGHDSQGGAVQLWSIASGQVLRTLDRGNRLPSSVSFSPDGQFVLAGLSNQQVAIWRVADGERVRTLHTPHVVRSADWSPDGRFVAAGCQDGSALVWETKGWQRRGNLTRHGGPVLHSIFSRDGQRLFTAASWGSEGRMSRVHDTSGDEPKTLRDLPGKFVCEAAASSKEFYTLHWADLAMWSVDSNRQLLDHTLGPGCFSTVRLSPDGHRYASAGRDDRMAALWSRDSQQALVQGPHSSAVMCVAIDPLGVYWATGASDGEVKIWHYELPKDETTIEPAQRIEQMFVASNDGTLIFGGDFPAAGRNLLTGEAVPLPPVKKAARISGDGLVIVGAARAGSTPTETIQIWERAGERLRCEFRLPDASRLATNALAISHSGRWLATRTWDGPVRLWDISERKAKQIREWRPGDCMDLAFSPDEKLLAGACQFGRVRTWDIEKDEPLPDLWGYESGLTWCQRVAFSPDGGRLAAGNDVGVVRVFDVGERRLMATLTGHLGETLGLQFLADNKTLAVAGIGPIRLWDVEIEQECLALANPDYKTFGLALSADGKTLLSRSDHGLVRLWKSADRQPPEPAR